MACTVSTECHLTDDERRRRIYSGEVFCIPPRAAVKALNRFAYEMIVDAFGGADPLTAHRELRVTDYVAVLNELKPRFTHHPRSTELLCDVMSELGADPTQTYLDLPKLRVVPPSTYLNSGLGYNYTAHRDTWYSAPQCQNNWWTPIAGNSAATGMQFHPDYWQRPVENSSGGFDAYAWNQTSRRDAAMYITEDPRPHPKVVAGEVGSELRVVGEPGSLLSFSGAQLHSTVPNETDTARLSIDFRSVHLLDLTSMAGPPNVDSYSTGTSIRDYLGVGTGKPLPAELIESYDVGSAHDGVLVFDPAVLRN